MESSNGKKSKVSGCLVRYIKHIALFLTLLSVFVLCFMWYFCSGDACMIGSATFHWPNGSSFPDLAGHWKQGSKRLVSLNSSDTFAKFNIRTSDVIVFLQIQNTGGSVFARHLIDDLDLDRPCICKRKRRLCKCYRPNRKGSSWFFSRYTSGWKCGVHPDWTELTNCVDGQLDEQEGRPVKRRYFYITVLRDPIKRFLNEFWNARRSSNNWKSTRHWCGGREVTAEDLPECFDEEDIAVASLDEFLSCSYNLAINRQTRMLADLTLVNCYNKTAMPEDDRDLILLNSAKMNLHKMAFFGLSEKPKISSYMFESTFNLKFMDRNRPFHGPGNNDLRRHEFLDGLSSRTIQRVKEVNHLDLELYQYARELFFYRFEKLKNVDPEFEDNFELLEKYNLATVDWADREDTIDSP